MLQQEFKSSQENKKTPMEIWNFPHEPGFTFQQYFSSGSNDASPYEALAVLKKPDGAVLPNNIYFDALREMDSGLQEKVDRFLLPYALREAVALQRLPVAFNVHLSTLTSDGFIDYVDQVLAEYQLSRDQIMFEIVEPHEPEDSQLPLLHKISSRTNKENGFSLIIDDHDFEAGFRRLHLLAPFCKMVKIDLDQAGKGVDLLQDQYPHLAVIVERVNAKDRQAVLKRHPGVSVQGYHQ